MAYDKAVDSAALDAGLTAIANAIREKAGSSDALAFPDAMAAAIAAIEGGGGNVAYGTVTPTTTGSCVTLDHNLGTIPTVGVWCRVNSASISSTTEMVALYQPATAEGCRIYSYQSAITISAARNISLSVTTQSYYFNKATNTTVLSPKYVVSGNTYFWMVMA